MDTWFPPGFDHRRYRVDVGLHPDAVLAALADSQHGLVARAQLLALGLTPRQIERRRSSGHLWPQYPGVDRVGRDALSASGRHIAAVLACGAGARLTGWSAASQRGLLPAAGRRIDVTVPPRRSVRLAGVRVRRRAVPTEERDVVDGIPSTTVARVLLDLSADCGPEILEWAWREALFRRALDVAQVTRLLGAHPGERGTAHLRELVRRRAHVAGRLATRLELRLLSIIREAGLPEPLCNTPLVLEGHNLKPDFLIPRLALVIEGDGRDGHADPEQVLSDAARDALYRRAGLRVRRYGWWETERERARIIAELRASAR